MLKTTFTILFKFLLAFVAYWICYFFIMVVLSYIPTNRNFTPDPTGEYLYIISNDVHTDICIPRSAATLDWEQYIDFSLFEKDVADMNYLAFGWGDKGFYFDTPTWDDLTIKTAAGAAFFPTPTAMHVTAYKEEPQVGTLIRKVKISKLQLQAIEKYILNSMELQKGKTVHIDCCRYEGFDDNFFEAKGSYHMFRTCNVWANQALKSGGIKTALWAPFDKCILFHF